MSIQYKTYPIYIDGGTFKDDVISVVSKPKHVTDYETAVSNVLDTIIKRTNGVGQILFNAFPTEKKIIIYPYSENDCNAFQRDTFLEAGDAKVSFSPAMWKVGGRCANSFAKGGTEDEVLLHELLHAYRAVRGTADMTEFYKPKKMYDTIEEFFAIVITNIYMSENGKTQFRRDHSGFGTLPAEWSTSEGFLKENDFFYWIEKIWFTEPQVTGMIAAMTTPFNPFRAYKDWLQCKVGALKNRQYGLNLTPPFR